MVKDVPGAGDVLTSIVNETFEVLQEMRTRMQSDVFGTYSLEMKRLSSFGSTTGTLALLLAGLACAGAARPGRIAPQGIELLAPTTITISNFPIHPALVFQLIREMYAEEGVTLPAIAEGDTLLVSPPVPRGAYEIVYRARLHPGERVHLVSLDALYRTPGDSVTYVLTQDARGELARVWNGQLRVTRKLYERRFGKCCAFR